MDKPTSNLSEFQNGEPDAFVVTKEGTPYSADKLLENKKKAIAMLDKMDQPQLYTKRVGNLPREFISTMFSKMLCHVCHRIPSPYVRYLCKNGHIFCEPCAENRCDNHDFKCLIENEKKKMELAVEALKKRDSSSLLPIPPMLTPEYWMEDNEEEDKLDLCQETLGRHPADPIFTAIWSRALWNCPAGCGKILEGRELLNHMSKLCEKRTKPESSYTTETSCGSDYASELTGSEDGTLVSLHNASENNDISAENGEKELKQPFGCSVAGCTQQVLMKDVVEHLILSHQVYAIDADADQRAWRTTGWLNIPQSAIEARRPFYLLIRSYRRCFLFCMEPSTENSCDVGFWIRRISNKENKEEEGGPYFTYDLALMDTPGDTQMSYKKICTSWRKPTEEVFAEKLCCKMPVSYVLGQFLHNFIDDNPAGSLGDGEKGHLSMKFSITVVNSMGELYSDEGPEAITSSMESLAIVDDDSNDIGITHDDGTDGTTATEDDDED